MALTIRDVAKAAGVSTATVSNVLNKTGKVGRHTHHVVLSAVKKLGYFPNAHARHLASRDSRTLGIIVSDIVNPFFPEVVKGFETRARQLGYDAILSDTNYDPRRTQEAAERMMEHNVRGVAIMTSEISLRLIHELARRRIAVTFLDLAPARGHVSKLRIDYFSGMKQIVEYLYNMGHRRIAFVAGRAKLKSNVARLEAYETCMREFDLEPGPVITGDLRFEGGLAAGAAIAKLSPRPTAVMAVNDLTAVGVLKGLLKAGLRVPDDIAVVGFDDANWATALRPPLTVVTQPTYDIGRIAAELLLRRINGETFPPKRVVLQAELVERGSSRRSPTEAQS